MPQSTQALPLGKRREEWLDIIRGVCSLLVLLFHIPDSPRLYSAFYTSFFITAFFFVSGYLANTYEGSAVRFLYNRVLKLLIAYVVMLFVSQLLSVSTVLSILRHPRQAVPFLVNYTVDLLSGYQLWFIPCLLCVLLCFFAVYKLCGGRLLPMAAVSAATAAVGMYLGKPNCFLLPWHAQTAMICQLFYMIGYCCRQRGWLNRVRFSGRLCMVTAALFFGATAVCVWLFGVNRIVVVTANNEWGLLPVTSVLMLLGNVFIVCLAKRMPPLRLLTYIGSHSLLYFALGSQCIDVVMKLLSLLADVRGLSFLNNRYLTSVPAAFLSGMLLLTVCWISDRFLPILNGSIKLSNMTCQTWRELMQQHGKHLAITGASVALTVTVMAVSIGNGWFILNSVSAEPYAVRGVSVSSLMDEEEWQSLAEQHVRFVLLNATEGCRQSDADFAENWRHASATGLAVGACHCFRCDSTGEEQAAYFIAHVPKEENSFPPVIRVDQSSGTDRDAVVRELQVMMKCLEQYYGKRTLLFVDDKAYALYVEATCEDCNIWYCNVINAPNQKKWTFWQYTDRMSMTAGGKKQRVSMSVFDGTEQEFAAYLEHGSVSEACAERSE